MYTKKILITMLILNTLHSEEMPIYAKPGQCFTKAFFPPHYTKSVRVVATKKIKLNESTVKYKVIPAKYSWHEERIKISDGREEIISIPAVYKTIYQKIKVEDSKKSWRKSLNFDSPKAFNSCIEAASQSGMDTLNAEVGTCFYEHYRPAKYETITEKILESEASQKIVITPAQYRTVTKKIKTEDETEKLIPVPIKYKKVKEDVVIAPARSEWRKTICQDRGCNQSEVVCLIEVPKTYKKVTKKVILEPAIAKRVAIDAHYQDIEVEEMVHPATTEVISIPPTYKRINKRVKVRDSEYFWTDSSLASSNSRIENQCNKICLIETPAKYKNIAKRVLVSPARSQVVKQPAKYKIVKVKRVERKAEFKKITVPSEYEEVKVEREKTKGYAKWIPVVCESNMSPSLIKRVQQALKYQGFYNGEIDGVWSLESKSATRDYQKANHLPVTRLSIETMKSLGI